ncbi:TIGR02270 family protein [Archangium violaceum]|uniref:TIGR02270 family protein n=1 Tax=Archangium violaceum TaxID=83451 RepID=UPI002B29842C|nr:TIGR02270 family protein [Archangium gephyra]
MWLESIYEEHLSEAAFLWTQWEQELRGARSTLTEVAVREERLLAHLDALVIGGEPVAEALLKPALEGEDPGEVFTAAFASIAETPPAALETVLVLVPVAPAPVLSALKRALELSGREGVESALVARLRGSEAVLVALALEVLAFRDAVPPGMALELLGHSDGRVAAAALRALGAAPRKVSSFDVVPWMSDPRPEVRWAAVELALLSGSRAAWTECRTEIEKRGPALREALMFLALGGDDKDLERLLVLAGDEAVCADALWALGFTGRVAAAELCLELTRQKPSVARLAGEAFSSITGLKLKGVYVEEREVAEEAALPPLEEEDLDADLSPKPEDSLPVPALASVMGWWQEARKDFSKDRRYLGGQPFSGATLLEALASGVMRRRSVHALELALRTHGMQQVRTFAFTKRQRAEVARAEAVRESLSRQPLVRLFGG